jgi:hypothetical protein
MHIGAIAGAFFGHHTLAGTTDLVTARTITNGLDSNLQCGAMENLLGKDSGCRKLKNLIHDRFQE